MKPFRDTFHTLAAAAFLLGLGGLPIAHAGERASGLSAEAANALANAEFLVNMAKGKKALWTTAAGSLAQAQDAAKKHDSAAVIEHAKVASEQAFLGMAQNGYPLTGLD